MLIFEYKVDASQKQYAAIEEAMRVVQFIRNKCLRLWMDERGISRNNLQCYCAVLAKDYPFATQLNSQARQASAVRNQGRTMYRTPANGEAGWYRCGAQSLLY